MHLQVISMAADAEDNIYVAGDFHDTTVFGYDTLIPVSGDVVVAKYDSAGNLLWYKQVGGLDQDNTIDIRLSDNNDVFLLVIFNYTTIIEGDTIPYMNGHQPLLIKYSTDGEYLWWTIPAYNPHGCFHPRMLRSDHENNIFIMNDVFYGTNIIFPDSTIADSLGPYYIAKYISDGVFQWVRAYNNDIYQMTTDMSNNLLLMKHTDTNAVFDFIKLSPDGDMLWKRKINLDVLGYYSYSQRWLPLLAADRFDNIYLATWYGDTITIGNETFIARGSSDIILVKYDSTGNPIWGVSSGGPLLDYPTSLFVKDDKIMMTGSFKQKIFFAHDSIIGFGTNSYNSIEGGFITEYDLNGENESVKKVYGKHRCQTTLVTRGKSIYLYGYASDSTYFDNYLFTVNYPYYGMSYLARFYDEPPPPEVIVDDYEIYPNPTKSIVNFNFNPAYQEVTLEFYNLQGAIVKTFVLNNTYNSIDIDFLSNGLYIVKIISEQSVVCRKIEKI